MFTYDDDKVALFIDGPNFYNACKQLEVVVDYKKLHQVFKDRVKLIRAFYFTGVNESEDYVPLQPLLDWLSYNEYTVVTKPSREYTDPVTNFKKFKCDISVDLAVTAIQLAPHVDHIVLFSGDGDFLALVEALQSMGKRVSIVSSVGAGISSDVLRRQADVFVDFAEWIEKDKLAKD